MGKGGSGIAKGGGCNAARGTAEWQCAGPGSFYGVLVAGSGDAGQASPLGGRDRLTAETVESPLRREVHGGFGERPGETDLEQSWHRAPGLLSDESGLGLRPPKGRWVR